MVAAPSPLQELADAAHASASFWMDAVFDWSDGKWLWVIIHGRQNNGAWDGNLVVHEKKGDDSTHKPCGSASDLAAAVRRFVSLYPGAVPRPTSVAIKVKNGPLTAAKLVPIAVRAWHEAYGLPIPSPDDMAKVRKAEKAASRSAGAETVALLATGKAGVKAFNRRPVGERLELDLRRAVLVGFQLDGAELGGVNLEGADFSGASLVKADFWAAHHTKPLKGARFVGANLNGASLYCCRSAGADFTLADLTGASLRNGVFVGAKFVGADLNKADLDSADLRGADFTDATLTGTDWDRARFDEQTLWPKGFKTPASLVWKGAGADPRLAPTRRETTRTKPKDFAGFLTRLEKAADPAKLDKALAMLKADRFRLFAKVEADQVVGVVKSQSDTDLVYSCRLAADGTYGCCTQNLNVCGGLRGSPCKHLLVLIVGLTQAGELDPGTAHDWTQASRGQKPALDKDAMTETFLRYKGAEAGEVDWRPTETLPEDFYAI